MATDERLKPKHVDNGQVKRTNQRVEKRRTAQPKRRLEIKYVPLDALRPYEKNARTHPAAQIQQLTKSVEKHDLISPLIADENGILIAGHGRLQVASELQMTNVPVIYLTGLSESSKRALRLADNKVAENAGWDLEILAQEIRSLASEEIEFEPLSIGFEEPEFDLLIQGLDQTLASAVEDEVPSIDRSAPSVTQLGDLWICGEHSLLCGDATQLRSFKKLMRRAKSQMVISDLPYNVPIDGHVCGKGSIKHREFPMASGEMSESEFVDFLKISMDNMTRVSVDGALHFIFMDWRHSWEVLSAAPDIYSEFKALIVWNKTNSGMGTLYRSKHELIFVLKHGSAQHINNIQLGRFGRNRTSVWDYTGVNTFGRTRLEDLAMHPTVKPVAMIADAMLDRSKRGGIVLDPFVGSGTTLIAAGKTGRRAYAMELDPIYVDVAIKRFEKLTNEKVYHAETGKSFDQIKAERASVLVPKVTEKKSGG